MRLLRILAALGLALGSFVFASPVAAGDPCYHGFDIPPRTDGPDTQVKMMPCAFAPTVIRVEPGATVTWFNDVETHLLTGANQEWGSRDETIGPGQSIAYRFDRVGTYPYACALHRGMSGAVVVGDGRAAAASADAGAAVLPVKRPKPDPTASAAALVAPPASARAVAQAAGPATDPAPASSRSEPWPNGMALALLAIVGLGVVAAVVVARRSAGRRAAPG